MPSKVGEETSHAVATSDAKHGSQKLVRTALDSGHSLTILMIEAGARVFS